MSVSEESSMLKTNLPMATSKDLPQETGPQFRFWGLFSKQRKRRNWCGLYWK